MFRNIFMVLLISELAKKWKHCAETYFFFDSGSPRGEEGVHVCVGKVCYKCIVHILKANKNSLFFALNIDLSISVLSKYLRTYSFALYQIRALERAFKKPNNG